MKMRRKESGPPSTEWDFSACLDSERNTCLHYEYAREFMSERADLKAGLEGGNRAQHLVNLLSNLLKNGEQNSDNFLFLCVHFPKKPWLELSREERISLTALRESNSQILAPEKWDLQCIINFAELRQKRFDDWRNEAMQWVETNGYVGGKKVSFGKLLTSCPATALTPAHLYIYFGHINYALISLDWRKSNNALVEAFEQLLKWRPSTFPDAAPSVKQTTKSTRIPFARRGGRGGAFDQLRQLAALRLKKYFGDSRDVIGFLDDQESDLPHNNVRSIENGAGKARAVLRKMEKDGRFRCFTDLNKRSGATGRTRA